MRHARLLGRLSIAFLLAGSINLGILGEAPSLASATAPVCPGTEYGNVCLVSSSSWNDPPDHPQNLHIVGQLRNDDPSDNLTQIRVDFEIQKTSGSSDTDFTMSTVSVLGPGEVSPFEDVVPYPANFSS